MSTVSTQQSLINLTVAATYLSREVTRLLETNKGKGTFTVDYAIAEAQEASIALVRSLASAQAALPQAKE